MRAALAIACSVVLAVMPARSASADAIPSAPPLYSAMDITPPDFETARVWGLNNGGQVVGTSSNIGVGRMCFIWDQGKWTSLWTPGARTLHWGLAINDAGQIAGRQYAQDPDDRKGRSVVDHACLYDGTSHDLGVIGPGRQSGANALNAAGHVVGWTNFQPRGYVDQLRQAFFHDGTRMHGLGSLPGFPESTATGINASDQVVGTAGKLGESRAFLWENGVMRDLGTLGGRGSGAMSINDAGQVVGWAGLPDSPAYHAFLYDGTTMRDLGTLPGKEDYAYGANSINNLGQVVGFANPFVESGPGFLYTGGVMYDISRLLTGPAPWDSFQPIAINDRGQIVGSGYKNRKWHAYFLDPVAAPSLTLSATTVEFTGPLAAARSVTLTNTGGAPLTIEGVTLAGPHAGSFRLVTDEGAAQLAPGATRTVRISFRPARIAGTSRTARVAAVPSPAARYTATLQIRHNDARPDSPRQIQLTAIETAPTSPAGLVATAAPASTQVTLTWQDTSVNESEFVLMRRTGAGLYARIAVLPPNRTSYTDTTACPSTTYTYILRAVNSLGASTWSNESSATTPHAPPTRPAGLRATALSATQVRLTWQDCSNETGFVLLRKTGAGLYHRIAVVGASITSYTDTTASGGTRYSYIMRAVNAAGVSAWSNEPSVITP